MVQATKDNDSGQKARAELLGKEALDRMPDGWKLNVYQGAMGWTFQLERGNVVVYPTKYISPPGFYAMVNQYGSASGSGGPWTAKDHYVCPREAARMAVNDMRLWMKRQKEAFDKAYGPAVEAIKGLD